MVNKRFPLGLIGFLLILALLLGSTTQATAETLNYKLFNHVTKAEVFPIPDAEGHEVTVTTREGVNRFENGEMAWVKAIIIRDGTKTAWSFDQYVMMTFNDGSIIVTRTKGAAQPTATAGALSTKWTGEIIHGTGRFQGIKGTSTSSGKVLPPEKGELGGKSLGEGIIEFTLPPK